MRRMGHFAKTLAIGTAAAALLSGCSRTADESGRYSRAASLQMLAEATPPDISPSRPIELSGHIAIDGYSGEAQPVDPHDRDERGDPRAFRYACEATCAVLLAMPKVTSVTVIGRNEDGKINPLSRTYRLMPRGQCAGAAILPNHPDQLAIGSTDLSGRTPARTAQEIAERKRRELVRSAENWDSWWKVRLATRQCLRAEPIRTRFDWTIRRSSNAGGPAGFSQDPCGTTDPMPVSSGSIELIDAAGTLRVRRSHATAMVIGDPPSRGICGFKQTIWPKWGWQRSEVERGTNITTDALLAQTTDLRTSPDLAELQQAIGDGLRRALANPRLPASDPAFALSEPWLALFTADPAAQADRDLLVTMIGDDRVTQFGAFYQVVRALGPQAGFLRAPIIARAARRGTDPDAAQRLSDVLAELPVAPLGADEQRILADPALRVQAAGLIRSAAANGQVTNAQLLQWLGQHLDRLNSPTPAQDAKRGHSDFDAIAAIRQAFCRRGGAANEVLTPLMTMQYTRRLPATIADSDDWQEMLARIGRPLDQLSPQLRRRFDPANREGSDYCRP